MNECWCCDPRNSISPRVIFNRPALSAIRYRVGTFSSFRRAMLESIVKHPVLSNWTAREADDFGIAFIELWAYLADVLTFYQERVANEAYLRTVSQRESIMRLVALIDYALRPGLAATAYLAFTVDKTRPVLPASLRVQSKPAPGQSPATFETESSLATSDAINRFRVHSVPATNLENYGVGNTHAIVLTGGEDLKPGQTLVFFAGDRIEEKRIVSISLTEFGKRLTWSPTVINSFPNGAEVYRFGRKFKLFGANAPANYADPQLDNQNNIVGVKLAATNFEYKGGTTLSLDGVVQDLKVNSQVLVSVKGDRVAGDYNGLFTITSTKQVGSEFGPLTATVTQIELHSPSFPPVVPHIKDIRTVQVYELTSGEISFSRRSFGNDKIAAGSFQVYSDTIKASDIAPGSLAIISDDTDNAEQVTIKQIRPLSAPLIEKGVLIDFTPVLGKSYSGQAAVMYGNVVKATHGETIKDETLGNGDGSLASQLFALKKSPVTYTPDQVAPLGARNSLQVSVNGVRWREVRNFYGLNPDERVFITQSDENDSMHVEFGDGVRGARLPSGTSNIHARYRKGWGKGGSIAAGKLTTLLDARPGLQSVSNPAPSFGWDEPETVAKARRNAPTTVLTFERAVSLRDFESLARAYPGVGKARAAWIWNDEQQVVQLTCAASDGTSIAPIAPNLSAYLDAHRDPNRQLEILDFNPVGVMLHAYIVTDPDYDANTVLAAAQQAMGNTQLEDTTYGYFAFERMDLGEDVYLSDVYAALQSVPGVVAVEIDKLHRKDSGVTLQPIVPIRPSELAALENPTDVLIEIKAEL